MLNSLSLLALTNLFQDVEAITLGGIAAGVFIAFVVLVELSRALIEGVLWLARRLGRRRSTKL